MSSEVTHTPVLPFSHAGSVDGESDDASDAGSDGSESSDASDCNDKLHEAVYQGDVGAVAALLAAGADAAELDCHGMTPLHFCQSRETAELLLAAGAVPWGLSLAGVPAACSVLGSGALAAVLDAAGPEEVGSGRFADSRNRLPSHHHADPSGTAGEDDADGAAAMAVIFSRGFSPDSADIEGHTPLMFAALHAPLTARAILAAGADPRARTELGGTALHSCCDAALATELIALGADPSARLVDGSTPLHTNDRPEIVAALVAAGADVNARTEFSSHTPLHLAETKERALALVAAGADLEARNFDGDTPLVSRADSRRPCAETIAALLDVGADPTAVSNNGASVISSFAGLSRSGRLTVAEAVARSLARAEARRLGGADGLDEDLEAVFERAYPGSYWGTLASLGSRANVGARTTRSAGTSRGSGDPVSTGCPVSTQSAQALPERPDAWARVITMPLTAVTSHNPATEGGAINGAADGAAAAPEATAYQMDPMLVAEFYQSLAAESCLVASEAVREARRARQESKDHVASLGHWVACSVRARDTARSSFGA